MQFDRSLSLFFAHQIIESKLTLKGLMTIFFFTPDDPPPTFPEEKLPLPCLPIILPVSLCLSSCCGPKVCVSAAASRSSTGL